MIFSLSLFVMLSVCGLALQQYGFMQLVRTSPPFKLIERISNVALYAFLGAWISGLYYYSAFYESFEQQKVLAGDFPWVHQYFVEPRGLFLIFTPIFSFLFLQSLRKFKKTSTPSHKNKALIFSLCALGFGALNFGIEMIIGGAVS